MENGKSSIQFTMIAVELIFDNPKNKLQNQFIIGLFYYFVKQFLSTSWQSSVSKASA